MKVLMLVKSLRLNSFPVRYINLWNHLDEVIVCSDSVVSFKTRLDKVLEVSRGLVADP